MLNSISVKRTTHDQIEGASKDPDIIKQQSVSMPQDHLRMKLPNGNYEHIGWLITKG
jgi:hypothetical protein